MAFMDPILRSSKGTPGYAPDDTLRNPGTPGDFYSVDSGGYREDFSRFMAQGLSQTPYYTACCRPVNILDAGAGTNYVILDPTQHLAQKKGVGDIYSSSILRVPEQTVTAVSERR